jgi:hypothetical protein
MKRKIYIAGKIGDLPEKVYKDNFKYAKDELLKNGFEDDETISPVDLPHDHGRTWSDYMKEDIQAIMTCTHLYALKNWRQSPGATIEVNLANSVGIIVIYQP